MCFVDGCDEGIVDVHLEAGVYNVVVWPFFVAEGGVRSVCGRGVLGCSVMVEWVGGRRGMTIAIASWCWWIGHRWWYDKEVGGKLILVWY